MILLDSSHLPDAGDNGAWPLTALTLRYWRAQAVGTCAGAGIVLGVVWAFWAHKYIGAEWLLALIGVLLTLSGLEYFALVPWKFRHYSYSITPAFIYIAQGKLLRRSMTIPTNKVVSVTTSQGPIMRMFGVSNLGLTTLLTVEDLGPFDTETAQQLRRSILLIGTPDLERGEDGGDS
jgi:membrane protein YdbS with pleckstrin-like domain